MTIREQALQVLFDRIQSYASVAGADIVFTRNEGFGVRFHDGRAVWLNLLDGDTTESVALMGGSTTTARPRNTRYEITHTARLIIAVRGTSDDGANETFDAIVDALDEGLCEEDLNGLVDLVEVQPMPQPDIEVLEMSVGFKVGELPILLLYTAPTAAG